MFSKKASCLMLVVVALCLVAGIELLLLSYRNSPLASSKFVQGNETAVSGMLKVVIYDYFFTPLPTGYETYWYYVIDQDTGVKVHLRFENDTLPSSVQWSKAVLVVGDVLEIDKSLTLISMKVKSISNVAQ